MANEASGCEVDLAEFDRLREEIDNRTELSVNLVLAEIAALGAGISVVDKVPDVLLGLAAVSGFLWLLWMDHTEAIHKIALYIAHELAPRIQISYAGGLGWEKFLRGLDSTDKLTRKGRRKSNIVLYIRLLFCG